MVKIAFSTTNIAPPGGEIKILFIRSKPTCAALSHAKTFFGYLYPSGESQKL